MAKFIKTLDIMNIVFMLIFIILYVYKVNNQTDIQSTVSIGILLIGIFFNQLSGYFQMSVIKKTGVASYSIYIVLINLIVTALLYFSYLFTNNAAIVSIIALINFVISSTTSTIFIKKHREILKQLGIKS